MSVIGIAIPNLNQGRFLRTAIESVAASRHRPVLAALDAGSSDGSREVLVHFDRTLAYWRSRRDEGQAAAINEGIRELCAREPAVDVVGWLNADDFFVPGGLDAMADALAGNPAWAAVTAGGLLGDEHGKVVGAIDTAAFTPERFAVRCTICQPASLIRREAWERVGGLDATLDMCFDYDLWWRLSHVGTIGHFEAACAVSRDHADTKTRGRRPAYFSEARRIVQRERGGVPWHWYISEALEREVGFSIGERPGIAGRVRAGVLAVVALARDRLRGRVA